MSDLIFMPAYQLAQMIREREVSAIEVLDAHLMQIAKHNSKLNAICTLDEEGSRHLQFAIRNSQLLPTRYNVGLKKKDA